MSVKMRRDPIAYVHPSPWYWCATAMEGRTAPFPGEFDGHPTQQAALNAACTHLRDLAAADSEVCS